ncbi:MAG: hypothetical protein JWN94_1461 [Betaproteobacteria bacterium]|nr:hypothetical protein [Betaproteobacteria bacterium]
MKLKRGQWIAVGIAAVLAVFLIYDPPFEAAAANPASSQVVYAPVNQPPLIGNVPSKIDLPLLLLELGFVAFISGAIFYAAGNQPKKR